jgi:nitrogen regulatory protein PII-like uncharacterized protein
MLGKCKMETKKYLVMISVVVTADTKEEAAELAQEKIGRGRWTDFDIKVIDESKK